MSWRLARSLRQLQRELDARFPSRLKPDWTIGDVAHQKRASDHNPNPQGVVCAIDVRSREVAALVAEHIRRTRDPRIKYVIHDSRIFSSYDHVNGKAYTWRPFGGNPHTDHAHISVGRGRDGQSTNPDLYDSEATWNFVALSKEKEQMLTRGSKGNAVALHQRALLAWKADALPQWGADADFGAETETAVKRYQKAADLEQTGNIDGLTSALLLRYLIPKPAAAGLTKAEAEGLFVAKGTNVDVRIRLP
jgi:hypothetical protein